MRVSGAAKTLKLLVLTGIIAALVITIALGWLTRTLTNRTPGESFQSAGVTIHYTDTGSGTPVILVHGFAINSDLNWRNPGIAQKLETEYRVITMDLRGHGLSGKPHMSDAYGLEMAEDVVRLMDHLGISKAHLAGYSLGGILTLKLAVTHPQRFLSIALLGSGWEAPHTGPFHKTREQYALRLEAGKGVSPLSQSFEGQRKKPGLRHVVLVWFFTRYFNDGKALAAVIRHLDELAISRKDISAITLSVCVVIGENDPLLVGAKSLKEQVSLVNLTIIPDADHITILRKPEFITALKNCL